jgi:hypothetical protein
MRFPAVPLCAGLASVLLALPVAAQSNSFVAGTRYDAPPLTTFQTFGENMLDMKVSWTFTDGSFGTASWGQFGPDNFGVNNAEFRVRLGRFDDTFMAAWSVTNRSATKTLSSVRFNGQPGRIVFDCGWTGARCAPNEDPVMAAGSVNSARGWSLSTIGFGGDDIYRGGVAGEYANAVGVGGAEPVGDLFEQLTISFTDGMAAGFTYGFRADTDNTSDDIPDPIPPSTVPEPGVAGLALLGALVLFGARRRQRAA